MTIHIDPKRRRLTDAERAQLRTMYEAGKSIRSMAAWLSVCTDTAKRILMREGIAEFEGAKFALSASSLEQTWRRPCTTCGSTSPRPKWQYRCDRCKSCQAEGLPDSWYGFLAHPTENQ